MNLAQVKPVDMDRSLDINQIMKIIPHRYPFLLIDRLTNLVPGESAIGVKAVTISEPFFQGHFPHYPVMPGVLIIEAMAQTSGIVVLSTLEEEAWKNYLTYFTSIEDARFRKPVFPGDTLYIHTTKIRNRIMKDRSGIWWFNGQAKVNGEVVAEANYAAMLKKQDNT